MSNHSGSTPTWITSTYLEKILQNALKTNTICIHDFSIGPGSSLGDNYACQIFRINCNCTVDNNRELKSVIVKVLPNTKFIKESLKGFDFFKIETTMLTEILPLLYEELHTKIPTEEPFFPILYTFDAQNKTYFMEDLKTYGYVLANKRLSLDLNHSLLVVKCLAKMHASSYLLFKKNPDYKNKFLDIYFKKQEGNLPQKVMLGTSNSIAQSLHLWPISEEDKEVFRNLNIYDLLCKTYERKDSRFNVLVHGDCWTNNVMFKYNKDKKPVSAKLIDFQFTNYNAFGLDLNYFLFTSAQEKVKLEHLEDVLKTYYDTFVSVTGEIEGFTIDTVRNEFLEKLGFGLCVAFSYRSGIVSDKGFDFDAFFEGRESEQNRKMYENVEYISELVKLLPMFKKYGVFK